MPRINLAQNERVSVEGINSSTFHKPDDASSLVTIDWQSRIAPNTIVSVINTARGITLSDEGNDATTSEYMLSGKPLNKASVRTAATLSNGEVRVFKVQVKGIDCDDSPYS